MNDFRVIVKERIFRDSNMELARIVAMFLVLVFHADFASLGWPSREDSVTFPGITIQKMLVESLSVVCVNLFVLISGWYGIKASYKKGLKLLSVALFYSIVIFCVLSIIVGRDFITFDNIRNALMLTTGYWFIKCYIILMILAPALNYYIEYSNEKQLRLLLLVLFFFQTIFGWTESMFEYHHGFSSMLFVFLYMLSRYARLYSLPFLKNKYTCLLFYFLVTIIISAISFTATRFQAFPSSIVWYMYNYLNPLVILSSLSLFLFFTKIHIKSAVVNWVASSVLAVYLIHSNDFILPYYYADTIYRINSISSMPFLMISLFVVSVFIVCILLDKVRILFFRLLRIDNFFE